MTSADESGSFSGDRITQVGIIVEDLEASIAAYRSTFGWGPWRVYDLEPPLHANVVLHGVRVPEGVAMRVALADAGGIDVELIQVIAGPSQHAEFISEHGYGINHFLVRRFDSGVEVRIDPETLGFPVLMSASVGSNTYAYVDGRESLSALVEVAEGRIAESPIQPSVVIP